MFEGIGDPKPISTNCFMYSLWNGLLTVYEGDVYAGKYGCRFFVKKPNKSLDCANKETVAYNGVVWLKKKDDKRAIRLMIEYQEQILARHNQRVQNVRNKLNILRTELLHREPEDIVVYTFLSKKPITSCSDCPFAQVYSLDGFAEHLRCVNPSRNSSNNNYISFADSVASYAPAPDWCPLGIVSDPERNH